MSLDQLLEGLRRQALSLVRDDEPYFALSGPSSQDIQVMLEKWKCELTTHVSCADALLENLRDILIAKPGTEIETLRSRPGFRILPELRPVQMPEVLERLDGVVHSAITFFDPNDKPYGFLSNFSAHPMELDSFLWPSSEHHYQASKFMDPFVREAIRNAETPHQAKRIAHRQASLVRSDWETIKQDTMRKTLAAKFAAYPQLKEALVATGERELVEASPRDDYWGTGKEGKGLNVLGQLLMEIRAGLQGETSHRL